MEWEGGEGLAYSHRLEPRNSKNLGPALRVKNMSIWNMPKLARGRINADDQTNHYIKPHNDFDMRYTKSIAIEKLIIHLLSASGKLLTSLIY